jgi:hypothetical protein
MPNSTYPLLHDVAELVRDALAIWGVVSLGLSGLGKVFRWRNHRREKREQRLERSIYRFLLDSSESHSVAGVWAEVVIRPLLGGVKLKYAVQYERFPGWKVQIGIIYWNTRIWWRKIGSPIENDVAAILADMHRRGEVQVNHSGMYRCVNRVNPQP